MNDKQIYEISLEDYSFPRYMSITKSYFGTKNDITDLIDHLRSDGSIRTRYNETIDAFLNYEEDKIPVHSVAGRVFPILTPVQEISRFETKLEDHEWLYTTRNSEVYPFQADTVDICQILVRRKTDYVRCLRVQVSNLSICRHGMSWVCPGDGIYGFPGIITQDGERHSMRLFAPQQHYRLDSLARATADLADIKKLKLSIFSEDMLGER